MDELVRALQGLQQDAEKRSEYNEWLQKFQRAPEAWSVCSTVLRQDVDVGLKIFCAQTLRNKATHDLYQVPDNKIELKENFLFLLEANASIQPVCVQLCVALANLAMQTPEWEQPLDEMVAKLGDTHLLPCLLEFLKILPEDFGIFGRAQRAARAKTLVGDNAPKVLNLLLEKAQYLNDHKSVFFEALLPWIPEVPVLDLVQSPMMDWIISALTSDDTISSATDCLCAVIHEADEVHDPTVQQSIEILLPKILALREASQHYDDEELHRNMTLIFSRAAEDWHMLIIERQEFRPLLEAVTDCVAVPDSDLDVVEYTFGFFDKFELAVNTPRFEHTRTDFTDPFERLQMAFTKLLECKDFPSKEEEENFKDFRYDIGDMIKICCYFLGPDRALTLAGERLQASLGGRWEPIEATLFCIRLMARGVPVENQVLPSIFDMLPQLPQEPKVVHAALLILGRYSQWAAEHVHYIPFELQYITQGVQSEHFHVRRAAAHALYFFLSDCARVMVSYVPQLVQFYNSLSSSIDLDSLCKIAEGVGAVINELNRDTGSAALQEIFGPVLQGSMSVQSEDELNVLAARIHALSGFALMVKTSGEIDDNAPMTVIFKQCHQQIMSVFRQYGALNDKLAEGVVRYYIAGVNNCALAITELLPSLLETCEYICQQQQYQFMPELFGTFAQMYNDRQESMAQFEVIEELFNFFERQTSRLLDTIEGATKIQDLAPELLESTFHFWCDCLVYYTPKFIFSENFQRTIKAAVNTLELGDTKVIISVAHYFEDMSTQCPIVPSQSPLCQNIAAKVASTIELYGEKLVYFMFVGYQFNYDKEVLPRADSILDFVARIGQPESIEWIRTAFNSLPDGSVGEQDTLEALQLIFSIMASGRFTGVGSTVRAYARSHVERNVLPR